MISISLFYATGSNTTLLVQGLKNELVHSVEEFKVDSAPFSEIFMIGNDYDIILLSPQVRFNREKIESSFPDKKIILMSEEEFLSQSVGSVVRRIKFSINN